MGADGKALLSISKALPEIYCDKYDKAMLSSASIIALKLNAFLKDSGMQKTVLGVKCGASKQAVNGWAKTGRIGKDKLLLLAEATGKPLEWWLDGIPPEDTSGPSVLVREDSAIYHLPRWPFTSIGVDEYVMLDEQQRAMVEGYIKGLLAQTLPIKSPAAHGGK